MIKQTINVLVGWLLIIFFVMIGINSGFLAVFHFAAGAMQDDYGRLAWSIIQAVTSVMAMVVAHYLIKNRIKK